MMAMSFRDSHNIIRGFGFFQFSLNDGIILCLWKKCFELFFWHGPEICSAVIATVCCCVFNSQRTQSFMPDIRSYCVGFMGRLKKWLSPINAGDLEWIHHYCISKYTLIERSPQNSFHQRHPLTHPRCIFHQQAVSCCPIPSRALGCQHFQGFSCGSQLSLISVQSITQFSAPPSSRWYNGWQNVAGGKTKTGNLSWIAINRFNGFQG